jgi:predicted acylesterase/phospholipase RssA
VRVPKGSARVSLEPDHRRPFVREIAAAEVKLCRFLAHDPHVLARSDEMDLRYALSLARVSAVPLEARPHAPVVELDHATDGFRARLHALLAPHVRDDGFSRMGLVDLCDRARALAANERHTLLRLLGPQLTPELLDAAVARRPLALVLGGGGGTGYVFVGAMWQMQEAGLQPDLISGASMGAILGAFRARQKEFPLERVRKIVQELSWRKVFRLFDTTSRYGLPATLKLYLRAAVAEHFMEDGRVLRLKDMTIPLRIMVGGIRNLSNPDRYAHLLDGVDTGAVKARRREVAEVLSELLNQPAAPVALGEDALTAEFDVVDAMGFSAAVPGVIHYDVLRDDPRMHTLLGQLMAREGVARMVDGGVADNLPSRLALEAVQQGATWGRDPFVLALDSFEPRMTLTSNMVFLPLMQMAYENSRTGRRLSSYVVSFRKVLSPLAVVPSPEQMEWAIEHGRREFAPHVPVLRKVMEPIVPSDAIRGPALTSVSGAGSIP